MQEKHLYAWAATFIGAFGREKLILIYLRFYNFWAFYSINWRNRKGTVMRNTFLAPTYWLAVPLPQLVVTSDFSHQRGAKYPWVSWLPGLGTEILWQLKISRACSVLCCPHPSQGSRCPMRRRCCFSLSLTSIKILGTFFTGKVLRANLACSFSEITVQCPRDTTSKVLRPQRTKLWNHIFK